MIGDEHGYITRLGVRDCRMFGDARVAREQDVNVLIEQSIERVNLYAM